MQAEEARRLLGFPPGSCPNISQVKVAYRKKVLESHPDRVPMQEKAQAESKFKLISEAYSCLKTGTRLGETLGGTNVRVVRYGAHRGHSRGNSALLKFPFILLTLGTIGLGGLNALRAYQRQNESNPSYNPFLP